MLEISWLGFYLLLHLLLALLLVPAVYALDRSQFCPAPAGMLRLWTGVAVLLFGLPVILLQPWALDQQLLPWLHGSVTPVLAISGDTQNMALSASAVTLRDPLLIEQHHFPLLPQLMYLFSPILWFWLLLPLISFLKLLVLLRSYLASRQLRNAATALTPDAALTTFAAKAATMPLPIKVHPAIQSPMLLGLRKPLILLPTHYLQRLSQAQLTHVLAHEQSHWQLGDLRSIYLQQIFGLFCWWSPCWRLLCRELLRWRELRADAAVLDAMSDKTSQLKYAQTLLDCSQPWVTPTPELAQRWHHQPLLALRIQSVITPKPAYRLPLFAVLATFSLLLVGTVVLANRWQIADLPKRHAQVRLSQLKPLSELLQAVATNNSIKVQQLLADGAPLNLPMPGEGSALMVAVRHQHDAMVELLLAAGADVHVKSGGDGNALIIAAQLGDLALARRLLQAGADVNSVVLADETALINASYRGDIAMAQLLLDAGAQINLQVETPLSDGRLLRSALNRAATAEMRAYLLAQGAR
ncbi:MAG: ankyrin repeat domain-containing protein [Gammaproteobacteria bacterium]|nr:ankyrin repeat domain-containing protein [Gammaproteobacteria bacterium]